MLQRHGAFSISTLQAHMGLRRRSLNAHRLRLSDLGAHYLYFTHRNRRTTAHNGVHSARGATKISSNIGTYPPSTYATPGCLRSRGSLLSIPFPLYIAFLCFLCMAGRHLPHLF